MVAMTVRQWRDRRQSLSARPANTMAITPCRFLPFWPTITRNVKLPHHAKPLELSMCADPGRETSVKSGKNGNVDRRGQHSLPLSAHLRIRACLTEWRHRGTGGA
jgi:hypothetical protein